MHAPNPRQVHAQHVIWRVRERRLGSYATLSYWNFSCSFLAEQVDAVEQPVELATCHLKHLILITTWPREARLLETLVPKNEATSFPIQDLDLVPLAIAEHKKLRAEGGGLELLFNDCRQAIDTLSHVDDPAIQIHFDPCARPHHRDCASRSTRSITADGSSPSDHSNTTQLGSERRKSKLDL
jgi:hypothetical protein